MHGRPLSILPEHFDVGLPSPNSIALPRDTRPSVDAQALFDLSRTSSAAPSTQAPDQSLMPSLSRSGRADSMPNISQLGLDSSEPVTTMALGPEASGSTAAGPSLEGWLPAVDASQTSGAPESSAKAPNPFALSLDPNSLLLDPAEEAQMFGMQSTSSNVFSDVSDSGWKLMWDPESDDYSSWNSMINALPPSSTSIMQNDDSARMLRMFPGPEEGGTRTYEAHVAHFHLAHILGRVTEDLLSLRPVPYTRVQSRDNELQV